MNIMNTLYNFVFKHCFFYYLLLKNYTIKCNKPLFELGVLTEVFQLLEVSWQMCHAWIALWTVARATLTMSRRRSTRNERTHGRSAREPILART